MMPGESCSSCIDSGRFLRENGTIGKNEYFNQQDGRDAHQY